VNGIRFRPEVVDDLSAASAWYGRERAVLGDAFLSAVERCVETLASDARLHPVVHRDVRRALVSRFPYAVYFVADGDVVTVIAVLHVRRNPEAWHARR
jgi:plasmid stabilization system protein ParE